jgi:Spy/CpxP family protein refolding chaperone
MHPAFIWWREHARRAVREGCGLGNGPWAEGEAHFGPPRPPMPPFPPRRPFPGPPDFGRGGPFGVRRPLRFLADKLDLSEEQIADLARILDALKTERAQADVDDRRTVAAFADAVEGSTFGEARATEGADQRVKTAQLLRDAVLKALRDIHAILDDDQRKKMAYLIRTGVLSL